MLLGGPGDSGVKCSPFDWTASSDETCSLPMLSLPSTYNSIRSVSSVIHASTMPSSHNCSWRRW